MADNVGNFRSPVFNEPIFGSSSSVMRTPFGNIRSMQTAPPIPPPVNNQNNYGGFGSGGYPSLYSGGGGYGGYGYGGYGGFNSGYGGYSGLGGFGGYGSYNRFGGSYLNANDPENQFIQIAEESSRPAFQSIESLVAAIGNIAAMLDSTFFAITSTFRAILGVTANFGRLRGVFAQFWQTFAIFRGLTWIYKKFLYWLRLSNIDPSTMAFKEAFAAAEATAPLNGPPLPKGGKGQSAWPVLAFLGFIFTAPYLIMKLLGDVTKSAVEESRNPKTWVRPIQSQVIYDFQARNPTELSIRTGQSILVAPKEIQNTHKLMNTGWALATLDGHTSGLIPISYIQGSNQIKRNQPANNTQIAEQLPVTVVDNSLGIPEQLPVATADNSLEKHEVAKNNPDKTNPKPNLNPQNTKVSLPVIPEANECDDPV